MQVWEWKGSSSYFQYFTTKCSKIAGFSNNNVKHHFLHYHSNTATEVFHVLNIQFLVKDIWTIPGIFYPFKKILLSVSKYIKEILNWQLLHTRCCSSKMTCHFQLKIKTLQNPLKVEAKTVFILHLTFCRDIWEAQRVQRAKTAIFRRATSKTDKERFTSYLMNFNENKLIFPFCLKISLKSVGIFPASVGIFSDYCP